jgi:TonB family protein
MSTPTELWKKWEGRVVEGKFPLRQWLGGSDHSAVFLTERAGKEPRKTAIKLIPAENPLQKNLDDAQLSRWADAAKLSHPHLLRLFECGRCEIDGTQLLYVVMEYAEENLGEILPLRPLSAREASEMLRPAAEVLAYLHQSGFAHSRIKPSNILAVDNQLKISADGLCKAGEHGAGHALSAYVAPEVSTGGFSAAADLWSLGATLVAVLTQNEPKLNNGNREPVAVPETIPQPLREIARQCLQVDPQERGTAGEVLTQLQVPSTKVVKASTTTERRKRWGMIAGVVAALFIIALVGSRFIGNQPPVPAAETRPANQPPADVPASQSPAPFTEKAKATPTGATRGSVLQQVLPDVSRGALNTITGRVKVSVQVSVDASGNVSQAKLVSAGPSQYFASRALAAARRWRFNPPQVDGVAAASEWVLQFQFGRGSINVVPAEVKP